MAHVWRDSTRWLFHGCHLWLVLMVLLLTSQYTDARKGGRSRNSGRNKMTNKDMGINYREPGSKAYYSHPDSARIIVWSHFESEYILGRKITFICTAKGNPRPHITWYKNGIELYGHSFFQVHEWVLSDTVVKSKMEIDPATQMDAGFYECQADNKYSVDFKGFRTDYLIEFE